MMIRMKFQRDQKLTLLPHRRVTISGGLSTFILFLFLLFFAPIQTTHSQAPEEQTSPAPHKKTDAPSTKAPAITDDDNCDYISVGATVEPETPKAGEKLKVKASVTYPPNCEIAYEWSCEDCGKIGNATGAEASFTPTEPGLYKLNLGIKLYFLDGSLAIDSPDNPVEIEVQESDLSPEDEESQTNKEFLWKTISSSPLY